MIIKLKKYIRNFFLKISKKDTTSNKKILKVNDYLNLISSYGSSSVLQNERQIADSEILSDLMGIKRHHDKTKTWDLLGFLTIIERFSPNKTFKILDAGSGSKAVVSNTLVELGYTNIYACDIKPSLEKTKNRSKIKYFSSPLEEIPLPDNYFDLIASMSVIEHLKDPLDSIIKLSKKLVPGGYLILSTDYWPDKISCEGIFPYGHDQPEMRIFSAKEIFNLIENLKLSGLDLVEKFIPNADEMVCEWTRVNRRYTFLRLTFQKIC